MVELAPLAEEGFVIFLPHLSQVREFFLFDLRSKSFYIAYQPCPSLLGMREEPRKLMQLNRSPLARK